MVLVIGPVHYHMDISEDVTISRPEIEQYTSTTMTNMFSIMFIRLVAIIFLLLVCEKHHRCFVLAEDVQFLQKPLNISAFLNGVRDNPIDLAKFTISEPGWGYPGSEPMPARYLVQRARANAGGRVQKVCLQRCKDARTDVVFGL